MTSSKPKARLVPSPRTSRAPFEDPDVTAKGEERASVAFAGFKTLWFCTGTLCNIECAHCYIESSPTNDRLVYLTPEDAAPFLKELERPGQAPIEIGFTGGEPFMNPSIIELARMALEPGHTLLILTNAMRPMMRPRVQEGLLALRDAFPGKLTLRVSLDHYSATLHDAERGAAGFEEVCAGIDWLAAEGFRVHIAGRTCWGEDEAALRAGYRDLFAARGWPIDAADPYSLVLFPEMDGRDNPPEITTACWAILGVNPDAMMCATSRMVVRRKGAAAPVVLPCTLLPYDERFEMGGTLREALTPVKLNHRYCSEFCVLGGGSCSA